MNDRNLVEIVTATGNVLDVIELNSIQWKAISFVDYIAVNGKGAVISEYLIAYGDSTYNEMQRLVNKHLNTHLMHADW